MEPIFTEQTVDCFYLRAPQVLSNGRTHEGACFYVIATTLPDVCALLHSPLHAASLVIGHPRSTHNGADVGLARYRDLR